MAEGLVVRVAKPFEEVVSLVRGALAEEGFGVLTEIDVRATMKSKLDEEMEDYLILGACNPPLAHAALQADRGIGVLLPCNVVVRADGDGTLVDAVDPQDMVRMTGKSELQPVADEAAERLRRALATLS